jgi:hypothetical protein
VQDLLDLLPPALLVLDLMAILGLGDLLPMDLLPMDLLPMDLLDLLDLLDLPLLLPPLVSLLPNF